MYPLGLEAVGASMVARFLLPGITNGTAYPRYYALLAWIVGAYDAHRRPFTDKRRQYGEWTRWRVGLEHAWRLCCKDLDPRPTGIIGIDRANRQSPSRGKWELQVDAKTVSAFDAAAYGASFRAIGFARFNPDWTLRLTPLGQEVYRAFDEALRQSLGRSGLRALDGLLKNPMSISEDALQALSSEFVLRPVPVGDPLHALLSRAVCPIDGTEDRLFTPTYEDRTRARAMGLLLELCDLGSGSLINWFDLLQVVATKRFPDGGRLQQLAPAFALTFESWERYVERQQQKVALGAFWHTALAHLRAHDPRPCTVEEIVTRIITLTLESPKLRGLGENATFAQLSSSLSGLSPTRLAARLWDDMDAIQNTKPGTITESDRLGNALVSIALLCLQRDGRRDLTSSFTEQMHRGSDVDRLPLPWFEREIGRRRETPLREVICWLVEYCVFDQAARVAFEKLSQGDRFFVRRDGNGYRLVRDPGIAHFDFDSNRLAGAISLLTELGYITHENDLRITAAGRRLRDRLARMTPLSDLRTGHTTTSEGAEDSATGAPTATADRG
jgi:hypothetical protein